MNQNLRPNQLGTATERVSSSRLGSRTADHDGAAFFRSPVAHARALVDAVESMPLSSDPEELFQRIHDLEDLHDAIALAEARIILSIAREGSPARTASTSPAMERRQE